MRSHAKAPSAASNSAVELARRSLAAIGATLLLCLAMVGTASAAATVAHPFDFSFDGHETPAGSMFGYSANAAIDESAGRVYVPDQAAGVINVFDTDGKYISQITPKSAGLPGAKPNDVFAFGGPIAVDNSGTASDGRIYVSVYGREVEVHGLVIVLDSAGSYLSTLDGSNTPQGFIAGYPWGLTVDDSGNLFLSNSTTGGSEPTDHLAVQKFNSSGKYLSQILLDKYPARLELDSKGNLYVYRYYRAAIEKFDSSGNFVAVLDGDKPTDMAVDRSNDHVYVNSGSGVIEYDENGNPLGRFGAGRIGAGLITVDSSTGKLYSDEYERVNVFNPGEPTLAPDVTIAPVTGVGYFEATLHGTVDPLGQPGSYFFEYRRQGGDSWTPTPVEEAGSGSGAVAVEATVTGLQHASAYEVRLAGLNPANEGLFSSGVETFTTDTVTPPAVSIDPVSAVTENSAHFSGSFNPQGVPTEARFEYRPQGGEWTALPRQGPAAGTTPVAIESDAEDLVPRTVYEVRLIASNAATETVSSEVSFETSAIGPNAVSGGAAPRTETTARLNGWVNPRNSPTNYYFEWGPTDSYGASLPPGQDGDAGAGNAQVAVSAELAGLTPGATYHFRLVAKNATGTTLGEDRTFQTRTAAEAGPRKRGIELVNNPEKGNQPAAVPTLNEGPIANRSATKILWTTTAGAPGGSTGTGSTFMAERTPEGWRSKSLLPAAAQLVDRGESTYKPKLASADFDDFLYEISSGILTSPPRTFATMDTAFNQKVLGQTGPSNGFNRIRANDDFSHVFTNATAEDDSEQIFDFATNPPTLVSVLPNGQQSCGVVNEAGYAQWVGYGYEWVATDAGVPGRAFFETSCSGPNHLYMREVESETTTLISGPALPGGPQGEDGMFIRASDDGSEAIFASTSRLSPEDDNDVGDLYRYTLGSGSKCLTCVGPGAEIAVDSGHFRPVIVSNDLSRIYFLSSNVLVPGAGQAGAANLYAWHEGQIDYVAPLGGVGSNFARGFAEPAQEGRVLFFVSDSPEVTADDLGGYAQIFRYAEADRSLECVSCVSGHTPTANAGLGSLVESGLGFAAENGNAFVFQTTDALSPRDVNGDSDAYEWRNGRLGLVTDGVTQYPEGTGRLQLHGMGSDGDNVVFQAGVNLTGYERDNVGQVYVARAGGGFPPPPPEPAPCGEESCQGPLRSPPSSPAPSSSGFSGTGNVQEGGAKPRKRCVKPRGRKAKKNKARKCVTKRAQNNKRGGK